MFLNKEDPAGNLKKVLEASTRVYMDYPIIGELCFCQAVLESRLEGVPSKLALEGNNLFGIKGEGTDGHIEFKTKEFINGKEKTVSALFAKNKTLEDSVFQHRRLMTNGVSWDHNLYRPVLNSKTFEEAAHQIFACSYATDPKYPEKLIAVHKRHFKKDE